MWHVPLFDLNYDEREEAAVIGVLRSKWLTMGPRTEEFEQRFALSLGGEVGALAVSSCTAALHLSLLASGIGPGDEVIVPALSFVASLNTVTLTGAVPVLADATSLEDWNIAPDAIRDCITPRTRAIIVVHFAGYPCDMEAICRIAAENNLVLIEDVAHAVGATYRGRACGSFGDMACFSFFSNKNLSTGEGGMVVTSKPELHQRLKLLRSHGMTSLTVERHAGKAISYDVTDAGLNYRIDEIHSAIGIVQLEKLPGANRKRRELVAAYRERLAGSRVAIPWDAACDETSSCHLATVLLPEGADRPAIMAALREKGIQTSIHYPSYHDFSRYSATCPELPVAGTISHRVLTLPLYPTMPPEAVGLVCDELLSHVQ